MLQASRPVNIGSRRRSFTCSSGRNRLNGQRPRASAQTNAFHLRSPGRGFRSDRKDLEPVLNHDGARAVATMPRRQSSRARITLLRCRVARASRERTVINYDNPTQQRSRIGSMGNWTVGAPGGNRTPGLQVRSLSLYPSQRRAHIGKMEYSKSVSARHDAAQGTAMLSFSPSPAGR